MLECCVRLDARPVELPGVVVSARAQPIGVALSPLAGVFSTRVFRGLSREWVGDQLRLDPLKLLALGPDATMADAFDEAHSRLRRSYRSEYVYKNEIVSKLIFGRHTPRTASAILEQQMGGSAADVLVLNGTSTIYEVKTDLDQFSRLDGQLRDYFTRADKVFVVTSERRAALIEKRVPQHVGVIALTRRNRLSTVRQAGSNLEQLDPHHLFDLLRTPEAVHILRDKFDWTPDVPRGDLRRRAREMFLEFSISTTHALVVGSLRRRAQSAALMTTSSSFPPSLRALAYGTELSRVSAHRLLGRLREPLSSVLDS